MHGICVEHRNAIEEHLYARRGLHNPCIISECNGSSAAKVSPWLIVAERTHSRSLFASLGENLAQTIADDELVAGLERQGLDLQTIRRVWWYRLA